MEWYLIVLIAYGLYGLRTFTFLSIDNNLRTKREKLEAIIWVFIPLAIEVFLILLIIKEIIIRLRKRLSK